MLTGLYALTGRTSPVQELALLPSALPTREDELRAIDSLEEAAIRIVVTDDRSWPGYGHTQLGDSFGRTLARWLAAEFEPSATFRAGASTSFEGPQPRRTLTIWTRRTQ
jgi:hypothetical protein